MSTNGSMLAITFAVVGIGAIKVDREMNYVDAEAVVNSVSYECTVEKGRKFVAHKDVKKKKAYMNCAMAILVAPEFDYKPSDVKYHATVEYSWTSPSDGVVQTVSCTKTVGNIKAYEEGQAILVGAHKTKPKKSYIK